MRIASSTIFDTGTAGIQDQQNQLLTLQQQISSGKSVNLPSDNPLAASQAVGVQQATDLNTQYAANQAAVTTSLQLSDTTLSSVQTAIQSIQTLIIKAGDASLTDTQRSAIAVQIQASEQNLVSLGNTTDAQGNYLYGGFETSSPPFTTQADGSVVYTGDAGQTQVQVSATRTIAANDTGASLFESVAPGTTTGIGYAGATNKGSATFGTVSVTNSANPSNSDTYQISFSVTSAGTTSYTVQDLTTNTAVPAGATAGTPYTAGTAISLGGQSITISGAPANGDTFTVRPPQSTGTTIAATAATSNSGTASAAAVNASDPTVLSSYHNYSIAYSTATSQYTVTDNSTTPANTYNVALGSGTPASTTIALGAGQSVTIGGTPANGDTFSVAAPTAIGNASTVAAGGTNAGTATINPVSVSVPANASNYHAYSVSYSSTTSQYTVTDSSTSPATVITVPLGAGTPPSTTLPLGNDQSVTIAGTPANGDSFSVAPQNVGTNLFTTLNNLIAALKQPGSGTIGSAALTNALTTAGAQLSNTLTNVLNVHAIVGAREQELTSLKTDNTNTALQLQTSMSDLTSTDIVSAYSKFQQLTVSLQAAEKTFVQVQSLTLFSIIQ